MENEINISELEQKAFNILLPFINKYDDFICSELFNCFDKNIIFRNCDGNKLQKKLIGFIFKKSGIIFPYIYLNDKFSNENVEYYNTFCYYSYTEKRWSFFWGNINTEEKISILKFVSITLIRKLKLRNLYE